MIMYQIAPYWERGIHTFMFVHLYLLHSEDYLLSYLSQRLNIAEDGGYGGSSV